MYIFITANFKHLYKQILFAPKKVNHPYLSSSMSLPQFIEFGNSPIPGNLSDQLQHYRLQINKLQRINIHQKQGYQKKIANLQQTIRQGGINSGQARNYIPQYTPASDINNEIVKRDRQINRLSQQNQRLRRNYISNPDTQLIKRRQIFDQVADKDTQIMKLKKTIYQLQAKYDGKYFNDTRMRNQYDLLLQQNKKLRQQIQVNYNNMQNRRSTNQVSNQLLQGIRYKKQYDLMLRQNQLLKNQYKRLNDQAQSYKKLNAVKINSSTDVDILKKQLMESNRRNQQLIQHLRRYQNQNNMLRTQGNTYVQPVVNYNIQQGYPSNISQQPYKVNNTQTLPNSPQRHRRPNIFRRDDQSNSPYNSNINNAQYVQQQNGQITQQQYRQSNAQFANSQYAPSPYPLLPPTQQQPQSYPQLQGQPQYQQQQQYQQQYPAHQQSYPQQQQPRVIYDSIHPNYKLQQKPPMPPHPQEGSQINPGLMDYQRQDQSRYSNSSYVASQKDAKIQKQPSKVQQLYIAPPPPVPAPLPPLPPQQQVQRQPTLQNVQTQRQPIGRQQSNQFYIDEVGTPLDVQQQRQLKKFSKTSQDKDSVSQISKNGQNNQGFIMQQGNQPMMSKQSSGSVPDNAPKTQKKRSLYQKFNIDQVTKNVVLELPKLAAQTQQH